MLLFVVGIVTVLSSNVYLTCCRVFDDRLLKNDRTRLVLPPLQIGIQYTLEVAIALAGNATLFNTARATLQITSAGLTAAIASGDRSVGAALPWSLDASASVDNDNVTSDVMAYAWSCDTVSRSTLSGAVTTTTTPGCVDASQSPLQLPSAAVVTFPAASIGPGDYRFTVTVVKGVVGGLIPHHYRAATASVVISVVAGNPPVLVPSQTNVVTAFRQRVTLSVNVTSADGGTPALQWSSPSLTAAQLAGTVVSPSLTQSTLALVVNLQPTSYSFVLTATSGTVSASTTIVVLVAGPPRNGYVTAGPPSGTTLVTKYSVSAMGWSGDQSVSDCPNLVVLGGDGVVSHELTTSQSTRTLAEHRVGRRVARREGWGR